MEERKCRWGRILARKQGIASMAGQNERRREEVWQGCAWKAGMLSTSRRRRGTTKRRPRLFPTPSNTSTPSFTGLCSSERTPAGHSHDDSALLTRDQTRPILRPIMMSGMFDWLGWHPRHWADFDCASHTRSQLSQHPRSSQTAAPRPTPPPSISQRA